jgi:hypothetical protein
MHDYKLDIPVAVAPIIYTYIKNEVHFLWKDVDWAHFVVLLQIKPMLNTELKFHWKDVQNIYYNLDKRKYLVYQEFIVWWVLLLYLLEEISMI